MKKLFKACIFVLPMMFLVACGGETKLSENFNETELKSSATTVIESISKGEYEKVVELESDEMKAALDEKKLEETFTPINEKIGAYKEISKFAIVEKDGNAIVVAISEYEAEKLKFTITFNKEMKIIGLYI